jgi:drug/metabolite transporter (DMT)-like permease
MTVSAVKALSPHATADADRPRVWLTDVSLVAMALIWGVNYSVVKYGTGLMAPLAYNAVRIAIASTVLSALAFLPRRQPVSRRDVATLFLLGMLGNGVYQVLFVEGLSLTRAGDAALVVAASPALMALVGRIHGSERLGSRALVGMMLSVSGIAWVVFGGVHSVSRSASIGGDLLVFSGALCWAIYTVLLTPYTRRINGITLSACTMLGGLLVILFAGMPALAHTAWATLPPRAWGAIVYSGLGALVIAYLFWYRGVRIIGPTRTAMYSNLQPVFALLVAWAMLAETPTVWQGMGAGSIMLGLLLART